MDLYTVIEVFGNIVFNFTKSVSETFSPEDPYYSQESLEYISLENSGLEWYAEPVDQIIYQEYSDKEAIVDDFLPQSCKLRAVISDASSPEASTVEQTESDKSNSEQQMYWKELRPSILRTICKSMVFGAWISLLSAFTVGMLFNLVSYLIYQTVLNCEFISSNSIPSKVQWLRVIANIILCFLYYIWYFSNLLVLFRPYQLLGVKAKLFLAGMFVYVLDTLYQVIFEALETTNPFPPNSTKEHLVGYCLFLMGQLLQIYFLINHLSPLLLSKRQKRILFLQLVAISFFPSLMGDILVLLIYPSYIKQSEKGKLIIALFSPLLGVLWKTISRICVQRLWRITHPAYSYVLMAPLYLGTAVGFRVLQLDLGELKTMVYLGIIHGIAEVIERSTVVVIDHICQRILKRNTFAWGSFRTPRTERITADIAIMSMLYESTAIVSVSGFFHLYQFIYVKNISFWAVLESFSKSTAILLGIEWIFTSLSLAIETRYQNLALMAVWSRHWRRHILVAVINVLPIAFWASTNVLKVVHAQSQQHLQQLPCKMPFS